VKRFKEGNSIIWVGFFFLVLLWLQCRGCIRVDERHLQWPEINMEISMEMLVEEVEKSIWKIRIGAWNQFGLWLVRWERWGRGVESHLENR
jgi:hypothetical protein